VELGSSVLGAERQLAAGAPAVALTFDPHPISLLRPDVRRDFVQHLDHDCSIKGARFRGLGDGAMIVQELPPNGTAASHGALYAGTDNGVARIEESRFE
jgi:hypothetical protein